MRDAAPWQKRYDMMGISAILFGLIGQYLLVGRAPGISIPLFVIVFYGLFFYAVKGRIGGFDRWKGQSKTGWLLLGPIGMISLAYAFFDNHIFQFFNLFVLFGLIVAQTMLITRGGSQPWHRLRFLYEHMKQWMIVPMSHLRVPFEMLGGWLRIGDNKTRAGAGKVGMGLLIAAPILIVVVLLLASADGIFSSWLNSIPLFMDEDLFGDVLVRVIFGGFIALYTFCYIWGLLFRSRNAVHEQKAQASAFPQAFASPQGAVLPEVKKSGGLDPVTAATVFICINVVYVLFAAIQFTYLFGAAEGILPEGTYYADYARQGFAELVAIALLNIGLLIVGLHYIEPSGTGMQRFRKLLLSLLVGCTVVMLISAYSRLSLYEEAYGYTQLRLLVHGVMILLGVLMAVALVRIWYQWFSLAKVYVACMIIAYVIMNYVNLDLRIANNNIERYEETGKMDFDYLSMLSADAAPAIFKFRENYPELGRLDEIIEGYNDAAETKRHWQSWNFSLQRLRGEGGN
ncbi:DUF4153 domain-containing protein [Paenibacillus sp. GCM10027627]|uniref:DUF4153 domain-containing protein n=1 Tax=unclassified Paenibacillus TaxID=185978 RepID=UPI003637AB54